MSLINPRTDDAPKVIEQPTCVECGVPIRNCGGGSWVHTARVQGRNHPAQPDRNAKERVA